ncbi:MAG: cupin domain-containing protein [Nitrospinales bacterium]
MSDESDLEKARPVCLREHIQYAAGAVVSKTLVNRKTGTITLFAFDAGQGLSEHTAPFDAVVQVLEGQAEITIDGKVSQVSAGQMIVMPANAPHALMAAQPFKMLLTMIRS